MRRNNCATDWSSWSAASSGGGQAKRLIADVVGDCVMEVIETDGDERYLRSPDSRWSAPPSPVNVFECRTINQNSGGHRKYIPSSDPQRWRMSSCASLAGG